MKFAAYPFSLPALLSLALLSGCSAPPQNQQEQAAPQATASAPQAQAASAAADPQQEPLQVTAATSITADFVRAAGGDRVKVNTLVPLQADPHGFSPGPERLRQLSDSAAFFINGAGLESWADQASHAAPDVPVFALTDGLPLVAAEEGGEHAGEEHASEHDHHHGGTDPHAWWDPELAAGYVDAAAKALTQLDPAGADIYAANAADYRAKLRELDQYGQAKFAAVPQEQRRVATEHDSLGYFARHFGIEVVGSILPGLSTEQQPGAGELADLARRMQAENVHVILTGDVLEGRLLDSVARETGATVVRVYTDSLGPEGSPGDTYLGALKSNIDSVAGALAGQAQSAQP